VSLAPPLLSLYDPPAEAEGSLDPLGLASTYDTLADLVFPDFTVRMRRPRMVTAIAVGARVCQGFEDEIAADRITPAYLVFEWLVVEGHVRHPEAAPAGESRRLPGSQKVETAIRDGHRVSHGSYLKVPKVFGITGIYKRLAQALQLTTAEIALDDGGIELIQAWERDQNLPGFWSGVSGGSGGGAPGAALRDDLVRAVRSGLAAGHTTAPPRWPHWATLARIFHPALAGRSERAILFDRLRDPAMTRSADPGAASARAELVAALQEHGRAVARDEEPAFLRGLQRRCSPLLRSRLRQIDAFEAFARPLTDALSWLRHLGALSGSGAVIPADFAGVPRIPELVDRIARGRDGVAEAFAEAAAPQDLQALLDRFRGADAASKLFPLLLEHHEEVQRRKPPDGKRSWFEHGRHDEVFVRAPYRLPEPPSGADLYVFEYRTPSVAQFLADLGKIRR